MNRKEHDRLMKPLCDQLNALIPIKRKEDKDRINALIADVQSKIPDFNLSWDRELYIDCGFDDEKVRLCSLYSGNVHFEPSGDPTEHPGVVVRYISNLHRFDGFHSIIKNQPLVAKTEEQRRHIEEILCGVNYVDMSEHGDTEVFIDGSISYDKMAEIVEYLRNENRID